MPVHTCPTPLTNTLRCSVDTRDDLAQEVAFALVGHDITALSRLRKRAWIAQVVYYDLLFIDISLKKDGLALRNEHLAPHDGLLNGNIIKVLDRFPAKHQIEIIHIGVDGMRTNTI